jgi:hypothetical protein
MRIIEPNTTGKKTTKSTDFFNRKGGSGFFSTGKPDGNFFSGRRGGGRLAGGSERPAVMRRKGGGGEQKTQPLIRRSCDPTVSSCMPEPAQDTGCDPNVSSCLAGGGTDAPPPGAPANGMNEPKSGGPPGSDQVSRLFGPPVTSAAALGGGANAGAANTAVPEAGDADRHTLLQIEYKPILDQLLSRRTEAEANMRRNDQNLFGTGPGTGLFPGLTFGARRQWDMAGAAGGRYGAMDELNGSRMALDGTLHLVGLKDAGEIAEIPDRFISMFRSKAREVADFMLDQSEAVAQTEYERYASIPVESCSATVEELRKSCQRLGDIQHTLIQVMIMARDSVPDDWTSAPGRPPVIDEDNYTDFLSGSYFAGHQVTDQLGILHAAIREEGLKFPVLLKEKLNYVRLGYESMDNATLLNSAMGISARTLEDIRKSRENIDDDNIWDLMPVIEATMKLFNLTPGSYAHDYLMEYMMDRQRNKSLLDTFLSAIGIVLALVAIIGTGGLAAFAIIGGAALGGYQFYEHLQDYEFQTAARGSSLDTEHGIGADLDPSALSLAFDAAMTFVSFLQAASAIRGLGSAVSAAERTGTALERIGENAGSMGFGVNVQRLAVSKGYKVEQISQDMYRITHEGMEGEYILTRRSIRYQTPSGTGMRQHFEIPFNPESSAAQPNLLPPGSTTEPRVPGEPNVTSPVKALPAGEIPTVKPGDVLSVPYGGSSASAEVISVDDQFVKLKFKPRPNTKGRGEITQSIPRERFNKMLKDGKIIHWSDLRVKWMTNRPKYRAGLVDDVWNAAKQPDGKVYDPGGRELTWDKTKSRYDQWHMGHQPKKEYSKLVDELVEGKITEDEFLKKYNDPNNYRPEDPGENMNHSREDREPPP